MAGWRRYTGLILLWQIAASVCFYAIYAVTPFVRDGFGVSATLVGVMLTALMFGYTLCLIPVGSLIDTYGEGRALVVGLVGLGVAVVAVTRTGSYPALLVSVFVLGGFYATAMPGTNKAVFNAIPYERLNTSMGIKQVGVTAGSGIAALAVPWFGATRFGWEFAFLLAAVVAGVVSVVFWVLYRIGSGGGPGTKRGGVRAHFSSPEYLLLTAAGFFLGAGLFTTTGYTILYVDESIGTGVVFAGVVLAAAQVSGSAGRVVFGWLTDRLSASLTTATLRILLVQSAASAVLFLAVVFVDSATLALVGFTALGLFVLGFTGVYYSCIGSLVPDGEMGSATAGGQIALNSGALCAPPAFGLIVDISGYGAAWTMLAAAAAVAFCLLLIVTRRESIR
jgi:MFS transporter, ACS family, hexuronate transporter